MKKLVNIITLLLISTVIYGQVDSVKAKVIRTSENTLVYRVNKMRFVSFDCKCDSLRRGDKFMIPKERFDSLLREAKPIRKRDL